MPQRFVYNARTGQLSGITTMRIGDPQVTIEEFVTSHIENNKSRVYDSDLVAATIAKNFDTAGPFASFDSDQVVAIINENVSVGGGFDSDQIVAIINEHITTAMQDSDYSAVAILRNDLESDSNYFNLKFIEVENTFQQLIDSESSRVDAVKRRLIDVEDNDSDKTKQITALFQRTDSDGGSLAGVKRFIRGENASPNNIFEYYSASGQYGSNPFHDSDLVIASALKGINTTATYDSDRVVTTIITAGEIALKDYFLDSDEVFNMGSEHGWFFDSDKVMQSVTKNINSTITISGALNDLLDSEEVVNMFVEHQIATQGDIDSEIALIKTALDSETSRIQLLLSNADSDQIEIAKLRVDADSDTTVIQALKTQAETDAAQIILIRNDLDSDTTAIQALNTRIDSDYARTNTRFGAIEGSVQTIEAVNTVQNSRLATLESRADSDETNMQLHSGRLDVLESRADSDETTLQSLQSQITSLGGGAVGDSDLKAIADLRNDVDSDFTAFNTRIGNNFNSIQTLNSTTNSQGGRITLLEARRDSESAKVQTINGTVATLQATQNAYGGRITSLESRADSDEIAISKLRADLDSESAVIRQLRAEQDSDSTNSGSGGISGTGMTDSDLKIVADLRNDVDSDSGIIQTHSGRLDILESRADSDEIAISARLPLAGGTMSGDIDGNGNKVLFGNVYPNFSDLPNATTYHGMFAHVHATGAGYFAHAGNWVRLSNYNEVAFKSDLDSETARIQLLLASTDSDALSLAELRQSADSDANTILILRQNAESDSAAIQALQSSLGPRLDSDELKIQALDTELSSLETSLTARLDSDETAIQSVRTDMDVSFNVTNSGSSAYTFTGDGFPAGVNNPTLYLNRGHTYNFIVNASSHPFQIRLSSGGSAYSDGVTNNGAQVGLVKFVVPMNAPESLVYQCTVHGGMVGTIRIGKQGFDSDQIASMILENAGAGITDSDLKVVADLRNDLDSEILVIRQLRAEQDSDSQNSGGSGGGGSSLTIQDEGSSLSTAATTLNFVGSGVTASGTGAVKTITISGGGGSGSFADSDLKAVADLRNDVDSDSAKIQSLQEQINNLDLSSSVPKEVQFTTFKYKAVQGQTTFSGVDRDDQTLAYTVGRLNVFLNGVLINDSDDYTASNGTSVVLALAADSDDVVVIQKYRAAFDSEAIIAIMNANLTGMADSDLKVVADLRNDLDSDRQNKQNITVERFDFSATQGQTTFSGADINGSTLSYIQDRIQVYLNGILMLSGTDYTATNGTSVVLLSAADSDDKLSVIKYLGIDATVSDQIRITRFTFKYGEAGNSTVGDSDITGADENGNTLAYTVGKIQVYSNGILLEDSDDYIATDGSTVTLRAAPDSDDVVSIFKYLGTVQQGFDSEQVVAIVNENSSAGFDSDQVVAIINENSSGGGSLAGWTAPTDSEYQLVAGQQVILDTSAWPRSVILPSSATLGDEVRVLDGVGMAATYPITVSRNGHRIMGDSDDMTVNTDNAGFALVYYNATYGWRLKEN